MYDEFYVPEIVSVGAESLWGGGFIYINMFLNVSILMKNALLQRKTF